MCIKHRTLWALTISLAGLLSVAPLQGQAQNDGPQDVLVRTRDYQFDAPEVIRSGPTHLRLLNEGPDFHHVWLVRLLDGKTPDDLMAHFSEGEGPMPSWAVDEGGPNTPGRPGEETSVYLDLKPGSYAMICVIPAATDGLLHLQHGMIRPLTVEEATGEPATFPEADIDMILDDYSFGLSKIITPGRHTIRVENRAAQPHEVVIVRLAEGKTAQDYLQWVGTSREAEAEPGRMLGGVTGMAQGGFNILTLDFQPGRYALLCFVPDAGDGMPHFMHGMVQEFDVG
jgi:hypothetical protein